MADSRAIEEWSGAAGGRPTRRSSEREPADSLRDKSNATGGWLPSLTSSFGSGMSQSMKTLIDALAVVIDRVVWGIGCFVIIAYAWDNWPKGCDLAVLVSIVAFGVWYFRRFCLQPFRAGLREHPIERTGAEPSTPVNRR